MRYLGGVMSLKVVTLDVREDLRRGREPFGRIMGAVDQLKPNESLRLIAPLHPTPLIAIMTNRGFSHQAKEIGGGDWEVLFEPAKDKARSPAPAEPPPCPARPTKAVQLDARDLEPPQPMVKILEALAELPDDAELRAHTDRRPMHLLAQLEERGYRSTTEEQKDGSYITTIRRA